MHDGLKYTPNRLRGPKYSSCALIPINVATPESGTNKISVLPQHNCEKRLLASLCLCPFFRLSALKIKALSGTIFVKLCDGIFGKTCQQNCFF